MFFQFGPLCTGSLGLKVAKFSFACFELEKPKKWSTGGRLLENQVEMSPGEAGRGSGEAGRGPGEAWRAQGCDGARENACVSGGYESVSWGK